MSVPQLVLSLGLCVPQKMNKSKKHGFRPTGVQRVSTKKKCEGHEKERRLAYPMTSCFLVPHTWRLIYAQFCGEKHMSFLALEMQCFLRRLSERTEIEI